MVAALNKRHIAAANILKVWESLPGIVQVKYDGQMIFEIFGIPGTRCNIETSLDLKQWNLIGQVTLKTSRTLFRDLRRIWQPHCFYRAKAVE